jgi:hypothetical protein
MYADYGDGELAGMDVRGYRHYGDGWEGATWRLENTNGEIKAGPFSLGSGESGTQAFSISSTGLFTPAAADTDTDTVGNVHKQDAFLLLGVSFVSPVVIIYIFEGITLACGQRQLSSPSGTATGLAWHKMHHSHISHIPGLVLIVLPFSLVHDLLALALWVLSGFHFGRSMPYSRHRVSKDFIRWFPERVDSEWARQHAGAVRSNPLLSAQQTTTTAMGAEATAAISVTI